MAVDRRIELVRYEEPDRRASDPATFLAARLDEDEEILREALASLDGLSDTDTIDPVSEGVSTNLSSGREVFIPTPRELIEYSCRWDPARARQEIKALRRLLEEHRETEGRGCHRCVRIGAGQPQPVRWPCPTIRLATWRYREDPDWIEEWGRLDG